jgi:hypothetical protein
MQICLFLVLSACSCDGHYLSETLEYPPITPSQIAHLVYTLLTRNPDEEIEINGVGDFRLIYIKSIGCIALSSLETLNDAIRPFPRLSALTESTSLNSLVRRAAKNEITWLPFSPHEIVIACKRRFT